MKNFRQRLTLTVSSSLDAMTTDLERDLNEWLRHDLGIEDRPRRVVRVDGQRVLVSKFEPGFAARLHELVERMPEVFDERAVLDAYEREAAAAPQASRVATWHRALHRLVAAAGEREGIDEMRLAEVRTGIDSVYAVLQSVLWSDPLVGDEYEPGAGEVEAYRDGLSALEPSRDLFTRTYGVFDGRLVQNHCPGAHLARTMLAQAWRSCTGTPAPEVTR